MNKRFSLILAIAVMVFSLIVIPHGTVFAKDIADGTYKINYEMKEAGSNSTSIADGYFSKPATLTVKNGVKHIQLTVTSSKMIKSLSAPSGPVDVVSDSGDTRTVKFRVDGNLSQPVNMEMHIVVPDLYDMTHTARAVFDVSGLPTAGDSSSDVNEKKSDDGAVATGGAEENPPTGDDSSIILYASLLLAAVIGMVAVWKLRPARD
ncbi:NEAT domain-containing protein [Virgibacillus soli]|uniref:NEAT domain-containing protein n=1 Tax=Paracerasibacillus soli TaxID=480284 RepID=A0ABU5CVW4_9BACI|nr:NEAT domain-containing protein [Virgibacillus soli]MDY0410499.1 NEAT domain-containing protein [Virgibacillus soli]